MGLTFEPIQQLLHRSIKLSSNYSRPLCARHAVLISLTLRLISSERLCLAARHAWLHCRRRAVTSWFGDATATGSKEMSIILPGNCQVSFFTLNYAMLLVLMNSFIDLSGPMYRGLDYDLSHSHVSQWCCQAVGPTEQGRGLEGLAIMCWRRLQVYTTANSDNK